MLQLLVFDTNTPLISGAFQSSVWQLFTNAAGFYNSNL